MSKAKITRAKSAPKLAQVEPPVEDWQEKAILEFRRDLAPQFGGQDIAEICVNVPDEFQRDGTIAGSLTIAAQTIIGPRGTFEDLARRLPELVALLRPSCEHCGRLLTGKERPAEAGGR